MTSRFAWALAMLFAGREARAQTADAPLTWEAPPTCPDGVEVQRRVTAQRGHEVLLVWDEATPGDAVHAVTERVGPVGERGSVTALVLAREARTIADACDLRLTLDGRSYLLEVSALPLAAPHRTLGMLAPWVFALLRDEPWLQERFAAMIDGVQRPEVRDYFALVDRLHDVMRQPPPLVEPIERSLVRLCCALSRMPFSEDVMAYLAREHGAVLDDMRRRGGLKRMSRDQPRDPLESALRAFAGKR